MAMQPPIHATCHMVSSGHHLATQAGYEVLEAGGNAIDAGVAAGIALGVVHSDLVQFAGVAPIMVYLAEEDRVVTISGLGWWPRAASLDRFVSEFDGHVPTGILRTVVPAAPDAWIASLRRYGTMGFAEVASAAVRYAREGFSVHPLMHGNLVSHADDYRRWPSNRDIYLPGGVPPRVGECFVQTDLGDAIQYMIDEESKAAGCGGREAGLVAARDAFYRGDLARAMVRYHEESGGWLTMEDLAEYESAVEDPVVARLGEIEVYTCGPWCQGPVLAQMVCLLDGMDVAAFDHNSVQYIHAVTEAMKLCFADRERYYGDPRFVDVPLARLLSADYGRERRALIRPERAWPGMPPAGHTGGDESVRAAKPQTHPVTSPVPASADTSYCCAIDRLGNCFSATPSDVSWQSPVIPGTGLCPSSRGSQSWAVPGHASCVAPGKRPRLTPNPAFARVRGRQAMPFGTPGGDVQTQAMLQVLLNVTRFGMSTQDAIEAPRFATHSFPDSFEPHEEFPGRLVIEGRIPDSVTRELAARGHDVERVADYTSKMAGVCAINLDVESGIMEGGADPRRMSRAMGR
jgi:gamma-glutamyltranspeptidase/glutathione hydrolase